MRTLWRYYSLRFLQAFAGSLLILALLVVVVDMLLNWGDIVGAEETLGAAVRVLLLRSAASYRMSPIGAEVSNAGHWRRTFGCL